jgi:tRNA (mo5U34)-methyltransferase
MKVLAKLLRPKLPDPSTLKVKGVPTRDVDLLSEEDLDLLNSLLPWKCHTLDGRGRPFGGIAGRSKRRNPQALPDPRIAQLNEAYPLARRRVLEIGCFEGVHTVGLCQFGADVVAVDARIENVVKTIVRANLFGHRPDVRCVDVDSVEGLARLPAVDIVHHVGVLYHLVDPVTHLCRLASLTRQTMMLDTHISPDGEDAQSYEAEGERWRYKLYREGGRKDAFSGMASNAKWLTQATLERALRKAGFSRNETVELRNERNGQRVLMYCTKH